MDGLAQLAQTQALSAGGESAAARQMEHPNVGFDNQRTLPGDFASVLESYRTRSDNIGDAVRRSVGDGTGSNKMLGQLADIYSYAVDTQLLVRASGQMVSGLRQLVSGQ